MERALEQTEINLDENQSCGIWHDIPELYDCEYRRFAPIYEKGDVFFCIKTRKNKKSVMCKIGRVPDICTLQSGGCYTGYKADVERIRYSLGNLIADFSEFKAEIKELLNERHSKN